MSRADYDDPLYKESIPQRITPAPGSGKGPTACWEAAQVPAEENDEATPFLAVVVDGIAR